MDGTDPRETLAMLIRDRGEDCASLSRLLGRNPAYLQQYLRRGSPRRLAEEDRALLARYFGVPEAWLGAPAGQGERPALRLVPRLDVLASAGAGTPAEDRAVTAEIGFSESWLMRLGPSGSSDRLSVIEVAGTSMLPTLAPGDEILVDTADTHPREGIFVLRLDDALHVKRLVREGGRLRIRSDNPAAPPLPTDDPARATLIGRVRWRGRRMD